MTSPNTVALDVLITACERRLGLAAPAVIELRRLRRERSAPALVRARRAFDALPGATRAELAHLAYRVAGDVRRSGLGRMVQKLGLIGTLNRRR